MAQGSLSNRGNRRFNPGAYPLKDRLIVSKGMRIILLQSVYGNIGQFLLKVIVHEVYIFVFRVVCCAGPAAKINFCSGPFDG